MSKERLEEIKMLWEQNNDVCFPDDYEWLIEQAEQVQELEGRNKELIEGINFNNKEYGKIIMENKRYREVIQEVKKSLITARKSYSNNKVNQQVYESLKTIQELEESE